MHKDDFAPADDLLSIEEKIDKYSGEVDWCYLKPHLDAGNLIYVDPCLDLKIVGLAFSRDEQDKVRAWLKQGDLMQPCQLHACHWAENKTQFRASIIRPFILAQPIK